MEQTITITMTPTEAWALLAALEANERMIRGKKDNGHVPLYQQRWLQELRENERE